MVLVKICEDFDGDLEVEEMGEMVGIFLILKWGEEGSKGRAVGGAPESFFSFAMFEICS